ncbi:uncharacterized protein LOC129245025 isoform X1 [Anastrepha obliqua]|uniref:uncharacterized protein LOC129245025 isoform X1 n=1 Tax=Anastrepha obliqua TaxID=95512 RepID=UPI00240978E1|nr:uncharacterized protein LOC129245025 isoform X1 [Anastrepha obliqua]
MYTLNYLYKILIVLLLFYTHLGYSRPQATDTNTETPEPLRNGRYVPELHGGYRGKYIPDESGKYRHVHIPYDGGYGDRGLEYIHDEPRRINGFAGLKLGPKDHLRFAIDFNYDGSGWQIVQFEWQNDDDENMKFNYNYQSQLWPDTGAEVADETTGTEVGSSNVESAEKNTNVHVSGEYQDNIYNVSYSNDNTQNAPSQTNIQATIRDVLDYIQTNILPTLK